MSTNPSATPLKVGDLHFDHLNPRLAEYGITPSTSDEDILKILWEAMDVRELVQSISASGYFPHEPIIVTKETGKFVVIEGNRRLAAVKVLLSPNLAKENGRDVPKLSADKLSRLNRIHAEDFQRKDAKGAKTQGF